MAKLYLKSLKKSIITAALLAVAFLDAASVLAATNDPRYWEQSKIWDQIAAPESWNITTGSKNIVVAVIDTGIDTWHDDLRDNLWVNPHEQAENGIDDDQNGFVDDISGWNFVENDNVVRPSVFDQTDDKEAVRHGTIVAGLIGARGNNLIDGTGLMQQVSIMTLRAIKSTGTGSLRSVRDAIDYAVDNGADIISMSFVGEEYEKRLYDSMKKAYDKGVVIVVAGGNYDSTKINGNLDQSPSYPGCFDKANDKTISWFLTVGSVDDQDKLSDFSEYGKCIDILAPGEFLYSSERYAPSFGYFDQFGGPWFGTSFATPLVAATAGLVKTIRPDLGADEILKIIMESADNVGEKNLDRTGQIGVGRLNVSRAVQGATEQAVSLIPGYIYWNANRDIWSLDLKTRKKALFTTLGQGKIIKLINYAVYTKSEVAVLVEKNKAFFLEFYNQDGRFSGRYNIPKQIASGQNFSVKFYGGKYQIYSSEYSKNKNRTEIRSYDPQTKKISTRTLLGRIDYWDHSSQGRLVYAQIVNGSLQLFGVGATPIPLTKKGVSKILDFKNTNANSLVLFVANNRLTLASVDQKGKIAVREMSINSKNNPKIKVIDLGAKSYILPYYSSGGSTFLLDTSLNELAFSNLPSIPDISK